MANKYDDLLYLPHPTSQKYPRMSLYERAAQFSPFSALTGHAESIKETARLTKGRRELDEYEIQALDQKLQWLMEREKSEEDREGENLILSITYFQQDERKEGGSYLTVTGQPDKIDLFEKSILLTEGEKIFMKDIVEIEEQV